MLKDIYERIRDLARPYLNTRKNDIHTEISTDLAQLLLAEEGGDEDIVIPAIILHDVGWKEVPEDIQSKAFGPKASMPEWNLEPWFLTESGKRMAKAKIEKRRAELRI